MPTGESPEHSCQRFPFQLHSGLHTASEGTWALPYRNPPLALVACEIRFLEVEDLGDGARRTIRDHVRPRLPLSEKQIRDTVTFQFDPVAPTAPAAEKVVLPRFMSRERTSALVISPTNMVIETSVYRGYEGFRDLIERSIRGIEEALEPDGVIRIGLRYIDEIRVPDVESLPGDWHGYIHEALLATVADEFLTETGLTPEAWQGLVRYSTGPASALQVRYGPGSGYAVPPDGPTRRANPPEPGAFFLLDSDSYWEANEGVPEFRGDYILELCDHLHAPTRAIFEAVSTDRLRADVYGGYVEATSEEVGE